MGDLDIGYDAKAIEVIRGCYYPLVYMAWALIPKEDMKLIVQEMARREAEKRGNLASGDRTEIFRERIVTALCKNPQIVKLMASMFWYCMEAEMNSMLISSVRFVTAGNEQGVAQIRELLEKKEGVEE